MLEHWTCDLKCRIMGWKFPHTTYGHHSCTWEYVSDSNSQFTTPPDRRSGGRDRQTACRQDFFTFFFSIKSLNLWYGARCWEMWTFPKNVRSKRRVKLYSYLLGWGQDDFFQWFCKRDRSMLFTSNHFNRKIFNRRHIDIISLIWNIWFPGLIHFSASFEFMFVFKIIMDPSSCRKMEVNDLNHLLGASSCIFLW